MKRNSSVPSIATSHGTQPPSEASSHRGAVGGLRKPPTNLNVRMSHDQSKAMRDIVEEETKQIAGESRGPMSIK